MQIQDYFYNFINGFYMMKQIPIMWNVIKMCIIVFSSVATTFIIAYALRGVNHQFWYVVKESTNQILYININSFTVIYIGSLISAILLGYFIVRIALIIKRNRQLKQTK